MVWSVLQRVFGNARYTGIGIVTAFIVGSFSLLLPNYSLIEKVSSSSSQTTFDKITFVGKLYGGISTNHSLFSASLLIVMAMLFSLNTTLLLYYVRRAQVNTASLRTVHLSGIGGMVSGILGIGCAACGSVILASVFGTLGGGVFIAWLPLRGAEFGLIGIILLLSSSWLLIKKINDPLTCTARS